MGSLFETLRRLGPVKLTVLGAVLAGLVTAFALLGARINQPAMGLLFSELSAPDSGQIVSKLEAQNIPFELRAGGSQIYVPEDRVLRLRMTFAEQGMPLGLALSLHATTDELRDQLVPLNQRWPLEELLNAARDYGRKTGRRVTIEYTLLAGVNDTADDAHRLALIARGLPSKINLIPYNPVPGLPWKRPTPEAVQSFAELLYPNAPAVTVRNTMGDLERKGAH